MPPASASRRNSATATKNGIIPAEIMCSTKRPVARRLSRGDGRPPIPYDGIATAMESPQFTVLPGALCPTTPRPPSTSPPPDLQRLVRIVVCGPARAGKTALLESLVHRRYVTTEEGNKDIAHVEEEPNSTEVVEDSEATRGSSRDGASSPEWQVDYFKKDYTTERFLDQSSEDSAAVRLQLYDVSTTTSVSSRGGATPPSSVGKALLEMAHLVFLVVPLTTTQDDDAWDTISDWLDGAILANIPREKIVVVLSQVDRIGPKPPVHWVQLGQRLQRRLQRHLQQQTPQKKKKQSKNGKQKQSDEHQPRVYLCSSVLGCTDWANLDDVLGQELDALEDSAFDTYKPPPAKSESEKRARSTSVSPTFEFQTPQRRRPNNKVDNTTPQLEQTPDATLATDDVTAAST